MNAADTTDTARGTVSACTSTNTHTNTRTTTTTTNTNTNTTNTTASTNTNTSTNTTNTNTTTNTRTTTTTTTTNTSTNTVSAEVHKRIKTALGSSLHVSKRHCRSLEKGLKREESTEETAKERLKKRGAYGFLFGTDIDTQCIGAYRTLQKYKEYSCLERPQKRPTPSSKAAARPVHGKKACLDAYTEEIIRHLKESRQVIVQGSAGSGKTTQIPQMLVQHMKLKGLVGCTQPRRIAAVSITDRMEHEVGKDTVGYKIRFEDRKGTQIKYMTEGILLREIETSPLLGAYSAIIVDEVHEKSMESQVLIKYIAALVRKRPDLCLVVMSASIDEDVVKDVGAAPIVRIEQHQYRVEIEYAQTAPHDYIAAVVEKVRTLAETSTGNMLVFLTGMEDIAVCYHLLKRAVLPQISLFVLHSKISTEQQREAVESAERKCILSTNIAETSLTIPGISHVIDCGMYKEMVYDPERNTKTMLVLPVQKAMAEQRAGRTGRTESGVCHRLYTRTAYLSFKDAAPSQLSTGNPESFVLHSLSLGLPLPPTQRVSLAAKRLAEQKLLERGMLTPLGKAVLSLPLSAHHALFLIEAEKRGCAKECAIILGMAEVFGEEYLKLAERLEAEKPGQSVVVSHSDHLTLLNLYRAVSGRAKIKQARHVQIRKVNKITAQLCKLVGAPSCFSSCTDSVRDECLLDALAHSHVCNTAVLSGMQYRDAKTGTECTVPHSSAVSKASMLFPCLAYSEIIDIHKPVLSIVSAITPIP
ncbi:pre-mRNA-splicing factor ATP-dependent RNA helicase DHX38/PRP16 [Nematocida sp. AWRm77]|nr:pre-mRNA-splicing factor ATP-dependent RNA helicase DHX38/PRP16 [Nematocida sp. AWRm77]